MIERIIENWLDKASERTYQIPFCYMLANEGHTILHLTRHCGMEHGKDVITIDPDGNICAFQLKGAPGSKIKLHQWQSELIGQVYQLVYTPVTHPSANSTNHHKSYFVTNGELEEEVFNAIDAANKDWELKGQPQFRINTIVRGELLSRATKLKEGFIPPEIEDFKLLLEFYLEEGSGTFNKPRLAKLLCSIFSREAKSRNKKKGLISSAALLTSVCTSSYSNKQNHVALVEAWMLFISYLFRFCEEAKLNKKDWNNEFEIAHQIIITSLENLWEEIKSAKYLLVGNPVEDVFLYNQRVTWLIGLTSYLGIYYKLRNLKNKEVEQIKKFTLDNRKRMVLWGESAIPCFLSFYWFYRITDATLGPTTVLVQLINSIVKYSRDREIIFPGPYYTIEECLCFIHSSDQDKIKNKISKNESYYLEGITHLLVRENYKQRMKLAWPSISRVYFKEFIYNKITDYYLWRSSKGKDLTKTPNSVQDWSNLQEEAGNSSCDLLPNMLKEHQYLMPLFLIVFPHRGNPAVLRWIEGWIRKVNSTNL